MLDATHLGFHLRSTRERRGLSRLAVAQALNLSCAAVTNIESGTRAVSTLELSRLANLYDCSPAALLEQATVPLASNEGRVVRRATDGDAASTIHDVINFRRADAEQNQEQRGQLARLAAEAYRCEEISQGRLRELAGGLKISALELIALSETARDD
jgi:transcriptional regulator with XRE-family HTH domain